VKKNVLALAVMTALLATSLWAAPQTSDGPEPAIVPATAQPGGSAATLGAPNPIENTQAMKALRAELAAATATGDPARIKAVHNRIQAAYLAVQPRQVSKVKVEPTRRPPQGMTDPGPDILVAGGPVNSFGATYTMDGVMYVAGAMPDSSATVFRSLDHGNTWQWLCGIRSTPNVMWPKVDIVVTSGDSAKLFLFALYPAEDGNAHAARFDTNGGNFMWVNVQVGPDTIGDFSFCADNDNWYYMYGCVYNTLRTYGSNGLIVRSVDLGKTWAVVNNFGNLNHVNYQNGAGRWQYLATASRYPGFTGQINLLTNHSYGDPASWFECDIRPDTFTIEEPVLCPAFTTPETGAVTWAAWHEINSTRPTPITLLTTFSMDGCATYAPPQPILSEAGAGDVWPDLQSYHSLGNTYMNMSYISLYNGLRRLFRRYANAPDPGNWSDTLRINSTEAFRSHMAKPRLAYSPGAPGTGAGCAFRSYGGSGDVLWNAPWSTAVAETPGEVATVSLLLGANPVRTMANLSWAGNAQSVAIYDAGGRRVRSFLRPAGDRMTWNLTDDSGRRVGTGVYIVRVSADNASSARTLVVQ
jgi:hypothetical protein